MDWRCKPSAKMEERALYKDTKDPLTRFTLPFY